MINHLHLTNITSILYEDTNGFNRFSRSSCVGDLKLGVEQLNCYRGEVVEGNAILFE